MFILDLGFYDIIISNNFFTYFYILLDPFY